MIHPFVYCKTCQMTQPFFWDMYNNEWVCFVCGHVAEKPEDEICTTRVRSRSGVSFAI